MATEGPEEGRGAGQDEGRGEESERREPRGSEPDGVREERDRRTPAAGSGASRAGAAGGEPEAQGPSPASGEDPAKEPVVGAHLPFDVDPDMLQYVQMVTGLIEGRPVTRAEILAMLERMGRQRSMAGERWIDYVLRVLKEEPP